MMVATVGCGFSRQPCSPWSGPRMIPAADRLAESHCSITHSLPCSGLSLTFSQMGRKDRLQGSCDF